MENFIINHPILSITILLILSLNLIAITWLLIGVWQEGLRQKIAKLKTKIKQERKAWHELAKWHMKTIKELREQIGIIGGNSLSHAIDNEILKDQLNDPFKTVKMRNVRPKLDQEQVEDMAGELNRMFKECKIIIDDYPKVLEHNQELKRSFDKHTEYSKKIEEENVSLHQMYESVSSENTELRERLRQNECRLKHEKITPKPVESDWWTPKKNIQELFITGIAYRKSDFVNSTPTLIHLWSGIKTYQVAKSDFMPCNSNGSVKNNLQNKAQSIAEVKS
jgi:regulator of replication initiation timing